MNNLYELICEKPHETEIIMLSFNKEELERIKDFLDKSDEVRYGDCEYKIKIILPGYDLEHNWHEHIGIC